MSSASGGKPSWGKQCEIWWQSLQRRRQDGTPNPASDPGALARLRRAASPLEAAQEPQTIVLYRRLHGPHFNEARLEATAVVAAVLGNIRSNVESSTAELLGRGDQPVMSPLRMRRLTSARNAQETLRGFREAVALLGGNAPVADVASSIFDWLDDDRADARKTRWLYHYYSAGIADPTRDDEPDVAGPAPSA
ncbi:MAG: type I-E CRISPR-associated protein Cse2/CasB [Agrobacterium albertimagni]